MPREPPGAPRTPSRWRTDGIYCATAATPCARSSTSTTAICAPRRGLPPNHRCRMSPLSRNRASHPKPSGRCRPPSGGRGRRRNVAMPATAEGARLRGEGLSLKAIARTLDMGRKTVRRWLRAGQAPTWRHADRGASILDPYQAYLEERWQAGCHNAAALWRDLKAQGFPGQSGIVRAWATRRRRQDPPDAPANMAGQPAASKAPEPSTARRAVRLLTAQNDTLDHAHRRFLAALPEPSP